MFALEAMYYILLGLIVGLELTVIMTVAKDDEIAILKDIIKLLKERVYGSEE